MVWEVGTGNGPHLPDDLVGTTGTKCWRGKHLRSWRGKHGRSWCREHLKCRTELHGWSWTSSLGALDCGCAREFARDLPYLKAHFTPGPRPRFAPGPRVLFTPGLQVLFPPGPRTRRTCRTRATVRAWLRSGRPGRERSGRQTGRPNRGAYRGPSWRGTLVPRRPRRPSADAWRCSSRGCCS